jgi:hypothetical protein
MNPCTNRLLVADLEELNGQNRLIPLHLPQQPVLFTDHFPASRSYGSVLHQN